MGQLFGEHAGIGVRGEVPVARSPPRDSVDDPADHLANGALALGGSELSAEILLSDDVRGVLGPGRGELHAPLLERVAAFLVIGDDGITDLYGVMYKPFDFDPNKKYPIIAFVYPGPQTESVTKIFSPKSQSPVGKGCGKSQACDSLPNLCSCQEARCLYFPTSWA